MIGPDIRPAWEVGWNVTPSQTMPLDLLFGIMQSLFPLLALFVLGVVILFVFKLSLLSRNKKDHTQEIMTTKPNSCDHDATQLDDFLRKINEIYSFRMNHTLAGIRSEIILAIVIGFIAGMFLATLLFVGFTISCYIYPVLLLLNGYTLYLGSKARRRLASDSLIPLQPEKRMHVEEMA